MGALSDLPDIEGAMRFDLDNCFSATRNLIEYQSNGRELYLLIEDANTGFNSILTVIYQLKDGKVNKKSYFDDSFTEVSPEMHGSLSCCSSILNRSNSDNPSSLAFRAECRKNESAVSWYENLSHGDVIICQNSIYELGDAFTHGWICWDRKNCKTSKLPFTAIIAGQSL
jgi:hypothetical protein